MIYQNFDTSQAISKILVLFPLIQTLLMNNTRVNNKKIHGNFSEEVHQGFPVHIFWKKSKF